MKPQVSGLGFTYSNLGWREHYPGSYRLHLPTEIADHGSSGSAPSAG
jgi:hypothetical protein